MSFALLRAALDGLETPLDVFFRDDDAGWGDEALFELCDRFADRAPLDLAVIPVSIGPSAAAALLGHGARLGFHQHGYAHRNHQVTGKKSELADDRPRDAVVDELRAGQARLAGLFRERLDPVFTPPWNRCGIGAAEALVDLGMTTLSRDTGTTPFNLPGLSELPISVDWVKYSRLGAGAAAVAPGSDRWHLLDGALAAAVHRSPMGVMLHHEVMEPTDLDALDRLLDLLTAQPNVRLKAMAELLPVGTP